MHTETAVLIAGAGPVGLALAIDLGRRGIPCIVVERNDGVIHHPRATAQNARTMEFFRRWGIANEVTNAGAPPDFPHTVIYVTDLNGFEIARLDRPSHGGRAPTETSPERPQRVNQLFLDPILAAVAASYASVTLRYRTELNSFAEGPDGVQATVRSGDDRATIGAEYLVDCTGIRGTIRRALGVDMSGTARLDHNLSIFFKLPELWTYHDKGKAALHFLVDAGGITRNIIQLDGRELWRLGVCDEVLYRHPEQADVRALLTRAFGRDVPFELVGVARWTAHDLVADSYGTQRVFFAGDAAHLNPPDGGFGLNTGMGDAVDLGWKLAAALDGWGGSSLLESYERERRPVAERNVRQSAENHRRAATMPVTPTIADASPAGETARAALGEYIRREHARTFTTPGTALGYIYDDSPIVAYDGSPHPEDTIMEYHPTTYPGARAPHAWIGDGRSIVDLYGDGFVLLRLGRGASDPAPLHEALAARSVPVRTVALDDPAIRELYQRDLVLVRPDGHVTWRGDMLPPDPGALADRVRGAAETAR